MVAKKRTLEKLFKVDMYPRASAIKAVNNSNACILISDGINIKRKNRLIDKIENEAVSRLKFILRLCV